MTKIQLVFAASALAGLLSGCGSGSDSALSDSAAVAQAESKSLAAMLADPEDEVVQSPGKGGTVFEISDVPNAWSNPATWGGTVPSPESDVTIEAGKTVILDVSTKVKSLTINGTLVCDAKKSQVVFESDWIMVMGAGSKLQCGTAEQPHERRLKIKLVGEPGVDIMGMGNRVLGAMDGGVIDLHGQDRTSWLKLAETTMAGSSTLTLSDVPNNWRPGHKILIASSVEDPRQAEERVIQRIDGAQVTLKDPLTYSHFGSQQTYASGSKSWTADTRAPVALMSRNIAIIGPKEASETGFGAHVMVMVGSKAYLSNVALRRAGQKSLVGRYPFHWHLVGDAGGQYVRNSVVNESYNRCYTIHGTDNAELSDNACYNHLGHGYFLEDGNEQGNVIQRNLGVLTVRPAAGENILASDINDNLASPGPATFWISNPKNTFVDNQAAGSDGGAYWLRLEDRDIPRYDGSTVNPRRVDLTRFDNNVANSSKMGYSSCPENGGQLGFEPPTAPRINNFTAFMMSNTGIWPCGFSVQQFDNFKVLDAGQPAGPNAGFTAPTPMEITNSLFVANSGLTAMSGGKKGRTAIGHYDQGFYIHDTHFVGYTKADSSSLIGFAGGAVKVTTHRMERVSFSPTLFAAYAEDGYSRPESVTTMSAIHDLDGSLGVGPNTMLVPTSPIFANMGCSQAGLMEAGSYGSICPGRMVRARTSSESAAPTNFDVVRVRNDGTSIATQSYVSNPVIPAYQGYLMPTDPNAHFGIRFTTSPVGDFALLIDGAWPNDLIRYQMQNLDSTVYVKDTGFKQVFSLTELDASTTPAWYRSGTTLHLRFRMDSAGSPWQMARWITLGR
jgi:cell surface hyaluronidase